MGLIGKGKHLFPPIEEKFFERFIFLSEKNISQIENELGGKILFTPGHTTDSISLKIDNIIFCGDASMNGFPSSKRITIWINDKIAFENSWNILLNQNAKTIYPAHGKPFSPDDFKKYTKYIKKIKLYELS